MANDATDRAIEAQYLMQLPAMPVMAFFTVVMEVPRSTAEELIATEQAPRMFLVGRRRYVRRQDALDWIDQQADVAPYVKRCNQKRRAA